MSPNFNLQDKGARVEDFVCFCSCSQRAGFFKKENTFFVELRVIKEEKNFGLLPVSFLMSLKDL
jgi:hypothetical protein